MSSFQMQSTNILRSVGGCPAVAGDPFFIYRPKDAICAIEGQIRVIVSEIRVIEYNKESVTK